MLDNLRSQTSFEPGDEEPVSFDPEPPKKAKKPARAPRRGIDQITGLKASQRFILALMLLVMTCLGGATLLILTQKIALPLGF
jgi:hypothetical protein